MSNVYVRPAARHALYTALIALTVFAAVLYLIARQHWQAVTAQWAITDTSRNVAAVVKTSLPNCTPDGFGALPQPDLTNAAPGLHTEADAPTRYQIYGNTADDLHTQALHCAPDANGNNSAEFTGQTAYSLDWRYTATATDGGCTLTDVAVGLRTAILLPYWQPTDSATQGLADRWQAFAAGLTTHENGHVAIDETYAAKLTNDLDSLGVVPCDAVAADARATTTADVAALNQANNTYDDATNHGASQGAVFPVY